jgi:hypothetical protein
MVNAWNLVHVNGAAAKAKKQQRILQFDFAYAGFRSPWCFLTERN